MILKSPLLCFLILVKKVNVNWITYFINNESKKNISLRVYFLFCIPWNESKVKMMEMFSVSQDEVAEQK